MSKEEPYVVWSEPGSHLRAEIGVRAGSHQSNRKAIKMQKLCLFLKKIIQKSVPVGDHGVCVFWGVISADALEGYFWQLCLGACPWSAFYGPGLVMTSSRALTTVATVEGKITNDLFSWRNLFVSSDNSERAKVQLYSTRRCSSVQIVSTPLCQQEWTRQGPEMKCVQCSLLGRGKKTPGILRKAPVRATRIHQVKVSSPAIKVTGLSKLTRGTVPQRLGLIC